MVALGAILDIYDAMDLLRIDPRIQAILLGIIVVLAVALDELSQRGRRSPRSSSTASGSRFMTAAWFPVNIGRRQSTVPRRRARDGGPAVSGGVRDP